MVTRTRLATINERARGLPLIREFIRYGLNGVAPLINSNPIYCFGNQIRRWKMAISRLPHRQAILAAFSLAWTGFLVQQPVGKGRKLGLCPCRIA